MRRLLSPRIPLLALVLVAALARADGAGGQPVLQPSVTVDGPSADIGPLTGLSVGRDGGGGLVYLRGLASMKHVFVSRLVAGTFAPPEEIDAGLPAASSQPVIAAGDNGLLLIAFINSDQLYVVTKPSASAPYSAPLALAAGVANPALALSIHAKGYLAFTAGGGGGHDVRAAYYVNGQWALESAPLDAAPADDAGTGAGRPQVAAAGDGVGIVVWGEAGHVYSRRVWGISPSVVFEQADVASFAGAAEVSADTPVIAAGDDSSFADVGLLERFTTAQGQQARVLMRRLRGSLYEAATPADGLTAAVPEDATQPQIVETGASHGLLVSGRSSSNQVSSAQLGDGGLIQNIRRVDTLPSYSASYAVPATAGFFSGLVAWQRDPGAPGSTEIRARFYDGTNFAPEAVISSPSAGPTEAASGLVAGGDLAGDVAVAWVQGTAVQTQIAAALFYYPPGSATPLAPQRYVTRPVPRFVWSAAREQWGPVKYVLSIDGVASAPSAATSAPAPHPLTDGPHAWQVTAVNQAGVATPSRASIVWVDTVAPVVQLTLTGRQRPRSVLHLSLSATDSAAGQLGSGISSIIVRWGDGASAQNQAAIGHAYARAGTYHLTVVVTDRAGNTTRILRLIRIVQRAR